MNPQEMDQALTEVRTLVERLVDENVSMIRVLHEILGHNVSAYESELADAASGPRRELASLFSRIYRAAKGDAP